MSIFKVSDPAWVPAALREVDAKAGPVTIILRGADAVLVVNKISEVTHKVPVLAMFGAVAKILPVAGQLAVPATILMPILAAVGGVSAAAGSVAFVAAAAVAHGHKVAFTYDAGQLFDPLDDQLVITLTP